jgi:3D (Asp-Asp-Asp) domain-containing protein
MIKTSHAIGVTMLALFLITGYFDIMLDDMRTEIFTLKEQIDKKNHSAWGTLEFDVTVTMYNPDKSQTDSTPNQTADGTIINPKKASEYRYVALSRDLIARWGGPFEYGDYVIIKGTDGYDGIYQVRDTMASKFINRVDILRTSGSKHFRFENATLYRYFKYDNVTLHKHEKP